MAFTSPGQRDAATAGMGGPGFEPVYLLVAAIGFVFVSSWLAWAAGLATALLSGHGWHPSGPGRALSFAGRLVVSRDPAAAWRHVFPAAGPLGPGWLFWTLLIVLVAAAVVPAVMAASWWRERIRALSGAQWARARDERSIGVPDRPAARPGRLTAGYGSKARRLLAGQDCISAIVFGPNGSGKTVSVVAPNVLEWDGPAVITTVKGPDLEYVLARRRELGPVHVVAPAGISGITTSRWSPVDYASDEERAARMARWLCDAAAMAGDPRSAPWISQARQLIGPLLLAAHASGRGLDGFIDWADRAEEAAEEVRRVLRAHAHLDALRLYNKVWGLHPDGIGSVKFTANTLIECYEDPRVRASASCSDFTVEELLANKGTLALVAPPSEVDQLAPMLTALVVSFIHAAERAYDAVNTGRAPGTKPRPLQPRLLLALDEAGNTFRYPDLPRLLTTARGMGIQLLTIWHDLSQLEERYGEKAARTILSQSKLRMILPGVGDAATLKYFTELLGDTVINRASHTSGDGRASTSTNPQKDQLAPMHRLVQLKLGQAVMQYDNLPPMQVRLRNAETDKALRALADPRRRSGAAA